MRVEQARMPAFLVLLVVTLLTAVYATRAILDAFWDGRRIPPRPGSARTSSDGVVAPASAAGEPNPLVVLTQDGRP